MTIIQAIQYVLKKSNKPLTYFSFWDMPVVTFDYNDFLNLLGYKLSMEEFLERIPMIGADLDRVEDSSISIEFFPNRPDLLSVEGIARAARTFFGFEKGLKKYKTEKSNIFLKVDPSVKKVRPFIVTALVKNIEMTDELISSLMDLQEKLHFGLGRERKKVAIGVHDFDQIEPNRRNESRGDIGKTWKRRCICTPAKRFW